MAGSEGSQASFTFGGAPPAEVSAYFREKNLRPAFRHTEVWGQEHAYAFTVAKAVQLDVLQAIKDSLQKAIDQGVPYQQWAKELRPELEKRGWWGVKEMTDPATGQVKPVQLGSPRRLQTIYQANLRSARAAGQWDRAQRTKAALPYFVYELGPSQVHRPEHVAKEGVILPVDDPFWNTWYPPNGWNCKCWLQQITRTRAAAMGGQSAPIDVPTQTFRRRRDDGSVEETQVPQGIDPGWANNPGKNRAATLMQSLVGKLETAGPDVARQAIADLWKGPTAEVLPKLPGRFFAPVAVAPPALKAEAGASADVVQISSDVLAVKLAKHGGGSRGLKPADVARAQEILDRGRMRRSGARSWVYSAELEDGWWELVVKVAAAGAELLVSTLHPVKAAGQQPQAEMNAGGGTPLPHGTRPAERLARPPFEHSSSHAGFEPVRQRP